MLLPCKFYYVENHSNSHTKFKKFTMALHVPMSLATPWNFSSFPARDMGDKSSLVVTFRNSVTHQRKQLTVCWVEPHNVETCVKLLKLLEVRGNSLAVKDAAALVEACAGEDPIEWSATRRGVYKKNEPTVWLETILAKLSKSWTKAMLVLERRGVQPKPPPKRRKVHADADRSGGGSGGGGGAGGTSSTPKSGGGAGGTSSTPKSLAHKSMFFSGEYLDLKTAEERGAALALQERGAAEERAAALPRHDAEELGPAECHAITAVMGGTLLSRRSSGTAAVFLKGAFHQHSAIQLLRGDNLVLGEYVSTRLVAFPKYAVLHIAVPARGRVVIQQGRRKTLNRLNSKKESGSWSCLKQLPPKSGLGGEYRLVLLHRTTGEQQRTSFTVTLTTADVVCDNCKQSSQLAYLEATAGTWLCKGCEACRMEE